MLNVDISIHSPNLTYSQLFGTVKSYSYYNNSQLPINHLTHLRKPHVDKQYHHMNQYGKEHLNQTRNHAEIHGMLNENNFFVTSTGDTVIKEVIE